MGYTPVFDSVFKGSLYGKWPDTAAWICMLALADSRGHIDIMPEAIAGMTGMPLPDLLGCIERFCAPDPRSRSQAEEGRKLLRLDPARDWGWRVVNIQLYRDRASGKDQVTDGRNAEKVKRYKERHPRTPRDTAGHRGTPPDTDSYSYSYSYSDKSKTQEARAAPAGLALHESLPKEAWEEWLAHRRKRRWPMDLVTLGKHLKLLVSCDADMQRRIIDNSINAGWQGLFPLKGNGSTKRSSRDAPTTEELEAIEAARARQ